MEAKKLAIRGVLQWFVFAGEQKPTIIWLEDKSTGKKIGELTPKLIISDNPEQLKEERLILEIEIDYALDELKRKMKNKDKDKVSLRDCWD